MKTIAQVSLRVLNRRATGFDTGFIQKIALQKIVQKCSFPVYSDKT